MRIAHVTATFPPYYAGTGLVCYQNAIGLARRGHQVEVFTAANSNSKFKYPEEIVVHSLPILFRIGNAPFLLGILGIRDFDIIHLHYPFIFGAEMIWAVSRIRKIPYVLTHHNDLIGDGLRKYIFEGYSMLSTRIIYSGAAKFSVVSKDYALNCWVTSILRDRWGDVVEIPNGVDTKSFRPELDGKVIRRRLGINDESKVLLFVGVLDRAHHFKGVDQLLRAISKIERSEVILMIIGDGDQKPMYIHLARELGLDERIYFLGTIPHKDLPPFFAAADVVVLPSNPPESFGMVLIEAMACGRPVIASNLPGVRTVVEGAGKLVNPGDVNDLVEKINLMVQDTEYRKRMGAAGRQKVEQKYAWPVIHPKLEALYESVITLQ